MSSRSASETLSKKKRRERREGEREREGGRKSWSKKRDCALMAAGEENKNSNSGGTGVAQASWAKEAGFLS